MEWLFINLFENVVKYMLFDMLFDIGVECVIDDG